MSDGLTSAIGCRYHAPVMKLLSATLLLALGLLSPGLALAAQPAEPSEPLPPASDPLAQPPETTPLIEPGSAQPAPITEAMPVVPEEEAPMSEGRRIVVAWNTGFQWGISPGVIFVDGEASFALGLRFGYGFDTGKVILVPGLRLAGYFSQPGVYLGMPVMKLVLPIDRFAPFVEAGAGVGYVSSSNDTQAKTGLALLGGGGFMVHFSMKLGLGVEANYQVITGTPFKGFGIGPIIALAF
ncbi:hypothetical protein BH11MYX4_BH11MYX4_03550 [soil metagenome]